MSPRSRAVVIATLLGLATVVIPLRASAQTESAEEAAARRVLGLRPGFGRISRNYSVDYFPRATFYVADLGHTTIHSPRAYAAVVAIGDTLLPVRTMADLSTVWRAAVDPVGRSSAAIGAACRELMIRTGRVSPRAEHIRQRGQILETIERELQPRRTIREFRPEEAEPGDFFMLDIQRGSISLTRYRCMSTPDGGLTVEADTVARQL